MGDVTRLPKWAQDEIRRLERDLASARERLAAGDDDSNTFAHPYSNTPTPLGRNPIIEFRLGESDDKEWGRTIRAEIEDGALRVMGGHRLTITPEASNLFMVRPG